MRKNEREKRILFWLSCQLFSAWKIVGMTVTCNRCDVKIDVRLNLFVFGSCFRTLAVILFIYLFMGGGGGGGTGGGDVVWSINIFCLHVFGLY